LKSAPAGAILTNFFESVKSSVAVNASVLASPAAASESLEAASKVLKSLTTSVVERKSLLHGALHRIEDGMFKLDLFNQWGASVEKGNECGALNIDTTKAFHKLWSALSFLFCLPAKLDDVNLTEEESHSIVTDEDEFGHGFTIGGCLFIHLLGQRATFELLDFSNHVLRVYDFCLNSLVPPLTSVDKKLWDETYSFIESAITQKKLQEEIFAFLEAQYSKLANGKSKFKLKAFTTFHPSADML
jgi:hypothetical protein